MPCQSVHANAGEQACTQLKQKATRRGETRSGARERRARPAVASCRMSRRTATCPSHTHVSVHPSSTAALQAVAAAGQQSQRFALRRQSDAH